MTNSARAILEKLISFDTTSAKSNLALIAYVKDYLDEHGIESTLVPNEDGQKASLFATIGDMGSAASDEQGRAGVGLSGHTDVVPVVGQVWDTDPFEMVERDGKLYGRGTCDMKGYLACAMASVPVFKARRLKTPIHLLFSYDEEVGCTGVRPMIAELGKTLPRPRVVLVGEPTSMQVVDGHKGATRLWVETTGRAAHSSMAHLGANAVMASGRMIAEVHRLYGEAIAGKQNDRFSPPHPTIQVNLVSGGFAQNVVPGVSGFAIDIRVLPGIDTPALVEQRLRKFADEEILPELRAVAPEAEVTIRKTNSIPPFMAPAGSQATSLALQLAGTNETSSVSYGTEAGLFELGGAPSIICGPGNIAQAHTANEFLVATELDKCMAFMSRLADWAEAN